MTDVAEARDDEIVAFAQQRWRDETSRRLYVHLASTSLGGARVVRDEGTAIAIGFAHGSDDEAYVSDLFVEPSFRENGIGHALFQTIMEDAGDRARSALVDPADYATVGFCARHGLAMQTPVLRVGGAIPKEEELAQLAFGAYRFRTIPIDPLAHRTMLESFDREVRATRRGDDHALFCGIAKGAAVFLDDEMVAYVYVWPDGRVGPIVSAAPAYSTALFAFGLVMLAREFGASWCSAGIPGTNLRVLRAALQIGLKIELGRTYATDTPGGDLGRYVGFHPLLF